MTDGQGRDINQQLAFLLVLLTCAMTCRDTTDVSSPSPQALARRLRVANPPHAACYVFWCVQQPKVGRF